MHSAAAVDGLVLEVLGAAPAPLTSPAIAGQLGLVTVTVGSALGRLEDEGRVRPVPDGGFPRGNPSCRRWEAIA